MKCTPYKKRIRGNYGDGGWEGGTEVGLGASNGGGSPGGAGRKRAGGGEGKRKGMRNFKGSNLVAVAELMALLRAIES